MAKVKRLEKTYVRVDGEGKPTKERTGTPTGEFAFKFVETGNELSGDITKVPGGSRELFSSLPLVWKNLIMHGTMQKCGDPAAGETGEDVEEAVTGLTEMVLAGNFYAEREKGEARPSLLAEAVFQFKQEQGALKEGETLESIVAKYAANEEITGPDGKPTTPRKLAMGNARVVAILAAKREEAARKRREAAEKKAAEAGGTSNAADL